MELMQASRQWSSRPDDERYTSLIEMAAHFERQRERSRALTMSSRRICAAPVEDDNKALVVLGPDGSPVIPSHWSFGQLSARVGAPAGYLRTLPSPVAADCINYGLAHRDVEDIGFLLRQENAVPDLAAATGPNYGRVWNDDIARSLVSRFGDGISGDFRVPGEFGEAVEVTKRNTTLYASDRDMFVFLADEQHRITVPNRRNGKSGEMARGFFVWNSEVGSTTLGIATFLFDYVCCNRIVWGAEGFKEVKIRHTSGAPDRWLETVQPALINYANSASATVVDTIASAQQAKIDNVDEFLAKRWTKSQVGAIKLAHEVEEGRPIETLWDVTTGATAYARSIQHQDERVAVERTAGAVMALAA